MSGNISRGEVLRGEVSRTSYIPRTNRIVHFKKSILFGFIFSQPRRSIYFYWNLLGFFLDPRNIEILDWRRRKKFSLRKISPRDHSSESTALICAGIGRLITDEGLYAKAVAHYRGAWTKIKIYGA